MKNPLRFLAVGLTLSAVVVVVAVSLRTATPFLPNTVAIKSPKLHDGGDRQSIPTAGKPSHPESMRGPLMGRARDMESRQTVQSTESTSANTSFLLEEAFALTDPLNELLDDDDEIGALQKARTLLSHANPEVRIEVVGALAWIGLPAAMELAKLIDDPHPEVQQLAEEAFWDAVDEADNPSLKASLLDKVLRYGGSEVREQALNELVFLPDALSFPIIASAMDDPDASIASLARYNIELISSTELITSSQAMDWFAKNSHTLEEDAP